jgi:arylsulfatase A-like enzyme/Flp pilus assembly protein TadD
VLLVTSRAPRRSPSLGAFLLALAGLTACSGPEPPPAARHVVLISIDTCRADHLGCYGAERPATPNIDGVARQATLFRNVLSPVPLTLPAHCSMLTGELPIDHGVHLNIDSRLAADQLTLAEVLRAEGFATGAVISSFVLDRGFGLDQGFDDYLDDLGGEGVMLSVPERAGEDASRLAVQWLARNRDRDGFLFLHYYDPHALWAPPEPWATRYADDPYAGEIAYVDACIGSVIDALRELGIYDSSLLIITGDHGEMLGEHGEEEHSYFIYQSALRVPLIIKPPHSRRAGEVDAWASLIDIVPTVCGALGIPAPPRVAGVDLLRRNPVAGPRPLYCESLTPTAYGAASLLGLVSGRFKLIQTRRPELYDLDADPGEQSDLAAAHPAAATELRAELESILDRAGQAEDAAPATSSRSDVARLEALGYVASSAGAAGFDLDAQRELEDPKDLLSFHLETQAVSRLLAAGRLDEATAALEKLLEQRPGYTWAHRQLGAIALKRQDPDAAIARFERALALDPELVVLRADLARLLLAGGRTEEALAHFRRAADARPDDSVLQRDLAVALAQDGRHQEAIDRYRAARDAGIESAELSRQLGWSLERAGQVDAAVAEYRLAVQLDPASPEGYLRLGAALTALERVAEAIDVYRRGLEARPDSVELMNNLAWKLATCRNPGLRDAAGALRLAEEANRLSGGRHPVVLDTLSAALAAAGHYQEAVAVAEQAQQAAVDAGSRDLAEEITDRLGLYRRGAPFVDAR